MEKSKSHLLFSRIYLGRTEILKSCLKIEEERQLLAGRIFVFCFCFSIFFTDLCTFEHTENKLV